MIYPAQGQDDAAADLFAARIGKARNSCVVLFRQKFGDAKGKDFADCMLAQERAATKTCGNASNRDEFVSCVTTRSIKVMEACDLTQC